MVRWGKMRAFNRGIIWACPTLSSRDVAVLVNQALITVVYVAYLPWCKKHMCIHVLLRTEHLVNFKYNSRFFFGWIIEGWHRCYTHIPGHLVRNTETYFEVTLSTALVKCVKSGYLFYSLDILTYILIVGRTIFALFLSFPKSYQLQCQFFLR